MISYDKIWFLKIDNKSTKNTKKKLLWLLQQYWIVTVLKVSFILNLQQKVIENAVELRFINYLKQLLTTSYTILTQMLNFKILFFS